jgi:hypothetical protein
MITEPWRSPSFRLSTSPVISLSTEDITPSSASFRLFAAGCTVALNSGGAGRTLERFAGPAAAEVGATESSLNVRRAGVAGSGMRYTSRLSSGLKMSLTRSSLSKTPPSQLIMSRASRKWSISSLLFPSASLHDKNSHKTHGAFGKNLLYLSRTLSNRSSTVRTRSSSL